MSTGLHSHCRLIVVDAVGKRISKRKPCLIQTYLTGPQAVVLIFAVRKIAGSPATYNDQKVYKCEMYLLYLRINCSLFSFIGVSLEFWPVLDCMPATFDSLMLGACLIPILCHF